MTQGIGFIATDAQKEAANCPKGFVVNLSFGVDITESSRLRRMGTALNFAVSRLLAESSLRLSIFVAAGNENESAKFIAPANYPGVCTIGSIGKDDSIANYSNYGPTVKSLSPD